MNTNHLSLVERRAFSASDYFKGEKHLHDPETGEEMIKIFSGDWYVTGRPNEVLVTILGSCVAACIRDPIAGVGGMNHFLLPGDESMATTVSDAARYGVFAMESLINALLKAGARKDRLEVKVFGGGNVIKSSAKIGSKNAAFIREFLEREGFPIKSSDLEGDLPRRIHYYPNTGKVMLRRLRRQDDRLVVEEEINFNRRIVAAPIEGEIDLF